MNDLISREVLLKEYEWIMTQTSDCNKPIVQEHIDRIKWQPAVEAEPVRHGKWIKRDYACGETEWECSACGETEWRTSVSWRRFCRDCGARMDEEVAGDGKAQD